MNKSNALKNRYTALAVAANLMVMGASASAQTAAPTAAAPLAKKADKAALSLTNVDEDSLRIDFNVNNVLNDRNATQVDQLGSIPTGVTLDQFIAQNPNALVNVQTKAPRSYFVSGTLRF